MFQKIDLEMPEEVRGNINEILMTNEALRNTIRSRVLQEELSQISDQVVSLKASLDR